MRGVRGWFRGRVALSCRSLRGVLAAALLFGIATAAEAQTTVTFVSNLNSEGGTDNANTFRDRLAQSFTTGASSGGYLLSSVEIYLGRNAYVGGTPVVVIRADSSGDPGDVVVTLTNPGSYPGRQDRDGGTAIFTAPAGTTLAASTTYWVVINDEDRSLFWASAYSKNHTTTGLPGWSMGGTKIRRQGATNWATFDDLLPMELSGTVVTASGPDAPANLQAVVSSGQVELTWDDPSDDTITKYQYQQRTPPSTGTWGEWTDISNSDEDTTDHTVTGLTNGTEYEFGVRAVAGSTNGTAATVSATPVAPPAAPTSLTARAGATQVTLSWTDPGNATITKYQVRYGAGLTTDSGFSWGTWADVSSSSATTTSATVTGLTNGTEYTFGVRAVGLSGDGAEATVSATPLASGAPAKPTGLTATAGGSSVTLSWTAPSGTITKYQVRQGTGDPVMWGAWADITGTTSHTVTGLTNGTEYSFQVRAVANTVLGAMSDTASATPNAPPAAPAGLKAEAYPAEIRLEWTEQTDDTITGYQYQTRARSEGDWGDWSGWSNVPLGEVGEDDKVFSFSGKSYYKVADLTNGTEYGVRIRAVAGTVPGAASAIVTGTPNVRPLAPTGLSATAGDGQVSLTWDDPSNAAITKYQVTYEVVATSVPATEDVPVNGATTSHTVTGLVNGTLYSFELVPFAGTVSGPSSGKVRATPTAPAGLTLTQPDDRQVDEGDTADTATFTVALRSLPAADVMVTVTAPAGLELDGPDAGGVFASSEDLAFTTANWNSAQTVTVRATDDSTDSPSGREEVIAWSATSTDTDYSGLKGDAATVTVVDNDPTTVTLAGAAGDVTEGGTKDFTVTLGRGLVSGERLVVPLTFGTGTGTATRNTDYTVACPSPLPDGAGVVCANLNTGNAALTFAGPSMGETLKEVTLTLSAASDNTTETGGETVIIGLGTLNASSGTGLEGGASGTDSLADFKITDPDASVPTVAITGIPAKINNTNALTATFTFSEAVTGFEKADITVTGGTAGTFSATSTTVYTLGITPDGDANVVVTVAANSATDGTNMGPASAESATAVWDETAPTVEITGVPGKISNRDAFTVTFSFSETVTGFDTDDVSVTNGDKSAFSGSGSSYTVVVTPNADADVTVTVAAGGATDGLNTGPANAVSATATWDASVPTVEISGVPKRITTRAAFTVTFTFSESVTDFVTGDVTVTNGDKSSFTGSGSSYTVVVTPNADADVTVTVDANSATDGTNTGPTADVVATAVFGAPAAPTVTATAGNGQVTLSWTDPSDDTITEYEYQQREEGGTWPNSWTDIANSASLTEYAVTSLTNGTTYEFRVRAVSGTVTSPASSVVTATPLAATAPGPPRDLRVAPGDGQVVLNWRVPGTNADAITKYEFRQGTGDPLAWGAWGDASGTTTSHTVTGLTNGTEYSFQVRAVANTVLGAMSDTVEATPNPVPAAPTNFTATKGTASGAIALSWTAPSGTITRYEYRLRPVGGDWPQSWTRLTVLVTSFTVGSQTDGTEYEIELRAVNDSGAGAAASATATPLDPTAAAAPTSFTATAGSGQVALAWTAPSGTITKYQVRQGTGDPVVWGAWADITGTTSHTVTSLTNGTEYSFQVRAVTGTSVLGAMSATATATPTAAPGVTISVTDASVSEADQTDTATFTVVLNTEPSSGLVVVSVDASGAPGLELDGPDAPTAFSNAEVLTFTTTNWNSPRTIRVRATSEATDNPSGREETITWTATATADTDYQNLTGDAATVTVVDNDPTTVTLAGAAGDVAEGATKTFTVTLGRGLVDGETLGVPLAFTGTATRGTDYMTACPTTLPTGVTCNDLDDTSLTPTVTFTGPTSGATARTVTLTLSAASDNTTETGGETVIIGFGTLTATGLEGGTSTTDSLADFKITDPDASVPTVAITGIPAKINNTNALTATFTFSEAVTGFEKADIAVTGGTAGTFSATSTTVYTLGITPDGDANVVVTVAANSATDGTNMGPASAESATAVWDETAPTVEITGVPGKISNRDAFTATFSFSETVTGFDTDDVSVTNGDKSAFSGSGSSYTVVVTPNADADVTVTVAAGGATDGLNTGPANAVSATAVWDETAPTVDITGIPAKINNTNALTATFTFSESVTGFAKSDITVTGGTAGAFGGSGTTYTLAITPTSGSNVVVTVAANSATDGTNMGPASAETATATWDASVPTVGITGVPARISGTSDLTATFTFSEDVTGFVKNDITVTGGTAGTFTESSSTVYTLVITPDGDANVVVTVTADSATDGLNMGPASAETATAVWTALVFNPAAVTVVEEASATYTVELSSQPDGNVTVTVSGASGEVTFDTDSTTPGTQTTALTFTTTTWDDAQTVTVLAAADGDTANDSATLTHTASGGGYGSVTGDVEVTVTDNDTPGLVLDPTSLTVAEGGSGTYTVALATQPTASVTVTVAGASGEVTFDTDGDTGGNQNTLTFTTSDWGTAQTVTVSAGQDNDADDDSATLTHSASGGGYGSVTGNVAVTVTDDDTASVVTTEPDATATEGSTTDEATFTVALNTRPSSDVTVTVTAPTGLTLDGPDSATTFTSSEGLTFTSTNWSTAQTVTVRATDDNDDSPIGRELTVTYAVTSSDSGYSGLSGDAATVTVVDDDPTTVTLAGTAGDVVEGGTKTFTVTLERGLVNGETLPVPLTFGGDATRGTDYTTACPTTLPTGVTCANLDSGTPTVTFTGPSTGATATTVTLTLTATTDNTAEAGGESVVIGLGTLNASSGTGLGGGASGTDSLADFDITDPDASAPTLEISGVPKRITTRAAFTVTFTFSESVTDFVTGDVTVTNGDKSSFTGSGSSYTVVVTPNADADVTVTVDADSATDGTNTGPPADVVATAVFGAPAAPASLSATAGNAAVTLSWTDPMDDTITGYEFRQGVQSSPVTWGSWTPITNSDKDTTSHTVTGLTDGTEYYFQVRAVSDAVMGEPSAEENRDAVVTPVAVNAPAAPTGLGATAGNGQVALSWTASSSNGITKHQVRSGSGDPLVWGSWTDIANSASITSHTVTGLTNGTEYSFQVRAVATAVLGVTSDTAVATPRGAAGVTTTQPSDRQVTEGDTSDTATFTVELDTQPSSDVTLTVEAVAGLELDGPDGATAFTASEALTFTSSNWGTAQTVTVRATDDSVDRPSGGDLTVSYSIASSDSGYNLLFGVAALVTVIDNDPTAVTLAGAAGDITEGETKDFTVTLGVRGLVSGETLGVPLTFTGGATRGTDYTTACPSSLPTGVTCNDLNTAATPTVTFTGPSTGETARTVTLTLSAATDNTAETGGETVMIGLGTLTATGLEGGASGTGSLADFRITDPSATDTTVPTLSISGVPGTISTRAAFTANFTFSESVTDFDTNDITVTGGSKGTLSGSGRSYRMRITPTGGVNVVVTVRRNAATDGTNRGPAAAVSRTATWRAPSPPPQQPPAEEDDDDPPSSGGGGGGGGSTPSLPSASLSAVSVSAGQMVIEGGEALFRITASPVPSDEITVRVRVSATGDFVDGVQLGERLVTLSASAPTASLRVATIDDRRNEADGTVTVTVLSGEDYRLSQASASLAVTDDDTPALVLTPETLTVDEGGSGNYRVALATEPAGDVTVSIAGTGEVTTAQNTLTFTAGNWNVAQPVTVSAGQDADAADDRARLDHRASGGGYDSVTGSVAVTVMDDDTPGLILTPAALTLAEGASASYTVALATEPTGNVTVSIAGTGDVTVDRSTLSFTARNWSAAQTVTLFAARDEDVANDSATLAHHARGGDYSSVTGSVEVTVTDAGAAVVSAHLARFGRTVAEQALDGIAGRLRAPRTAGMQKTLAGPRLNVPREGDTAQGTMHAEARRTGFENEYESQNRDLLHLPNAREMLLGSSFTLTTQEAEGTGGSFAFWGRASANRFDGATNDGATAIGLDGEVLTGLVGADYARGDWLFGLALTHSLSEGGYTSEGASGGKVDASLTAALPYASIQANPRLKLWGAGGYGIGEVTLKTGGESHRADTDWTMAAAGIRGDLLDPAGGPLAVAVIGDGLWTRSTSDEIAALSTADTFVTRLRLGVEASYDFNFDGMGDLTPRVEAGARHDGGDAETGAGMDLGVGINWKAPVFGLSLDVAGRMLILHENEDFADRGISAAVVFDPNPESERGPSLSLRQAIGGSADGGIEALFATTTPLGDGGNIGSGAGMRRTLETAYGFSAFGGRFTASPHAEVDFTERARDYALGWRFVPHKLASDLAFGIKATRREGETLAPVHVFGVEATVRW